jgi:hypothetical protein
MYASPKPPGRFLPTLTEVVEPFSRPDPEPEPESMKPQEQDTSEIEFVLVSDQSHSNDLVERIMQRLEGSIRAQIVTVVSDLLNEQIRLLEPRLAQEVLVRLRESVTKTVHDEIQRQAPSTTDNSSPSL